MTTLSCARALAAALTLCALAACGGDVATPASQVSNTVTVDQPTPADASPPTLATDVDPSGAQPVPPDAVPTDSPVASTGTCTPAAGAGATKGTDTPVAVLQAVRVAGHDGYDRVVLEFDKAPGDVGVEAVDSITDDGSGDPVAVVGETFAAVAVQNAAIGWAELQTPEGEPVRRYTGATELVCDLPGVREVELTGDFEGVLSVGIGLAGPSLPTVTTLTAPDRVVLDFPTG